MKEVRAIIVKCLENIGIFIDFQDYDANIIEYGMSSLDYVMLMCDIEETFNIEFPAEYLSAQKEISIRKLEYIITGIIESEDTCNMRKEV